MLALPEVPSIVMYSVSWVGLAGSSGTTWRTSGSFGEALQNTSDLGLQRGEIERVRADHM